MNPVPTSERTAGTWPQRAVPATLALLAAWSLVPLSIWWDRGDPARITPFWVTWAWGTLVTVLVFALAWMLTRGTVVEAGYAFWRRFAAVPARRFVAGAVLGFAALAVLMCLFVFAGNPRNVDGFAQLFQARMFLAGRLWMPPLPHDLVANFGTLQLILGPDKWYAQYPPAQPAVLAAGLALGAWWLLNPLLAGLLAWATWRVGRWCVGERPARLALVLLCLSPFAVAMAGSEMSHLGAAAFGMLAAALAVEAGGRRGMLAAAGTGAALGVMAAFRPLDAVAAAVPAGIILLVASPRRAAALAACAAAGAACSLPTLAFNQATTGSWHVFGYTVLWGPEHALGFHAVPFGRPLTALRAIAQSGSDLFELNTYLFDAPYPVLAALALGFLAGRRRVTARDAVPLAGLLALMAVLFAYWWRDVFYGPRFLFSAVPWLVLLLARGLVLLRGSGDRSAGPDRPAWGAAAAGLALTGMALGIVSIAPDRIRAYRASTPDFSLHPDRDAVRAGITNAVVVIPDGWGSRLQVRLWAAGVAPRLAGRLYGDIDACTLEQALDDAEAVPAHGAPAVLQRTLDSLAALHQPGRKFGVTDDTNLRLPADGRVAPVCGEELMTDRRGFIQFAPFLYLNSARLDGPVVWARDMGHRNAALFARYAGRAFYRYAPARRGGPPVFTRLAPEAP